MADVQRIDRASALKTTFAADFAKLLKAFSRSLDVDHLAAIFRAAAQAQEIVPPIDAALLALDDETLVSKYAQAEVARQEQAAPYKWAADVFAAEIERRLHERRKARGDETADIAIPHPLVDVVLEAQFGPYVIDVEQARPVLAQLPDAERAKLLTVIPAHTEPEQIIPARDVPEQVITGSIASWKSVAKKYAGSAIGKVLQSSLDRPKLGDRVTIRPKKAAISMKDAGRI